MYQELNMPVVIPKTDRIPIIKFSSNTERVSFLAKCKADGVAFTTLEGTEYSLKFSACVIKGNYNYIRETKDALSVLVANIKPNTTTVYDPKSDIEKSFNYDSLINRNMIIGSSAVYPTESSIVIDDIYVYNNDVLQHHYLPALDTENNVIVFIDTESDAVLHSDNNQMYVFSDDIFSNKTDIQIPEGNVTKIEDKDGNVLWSKKS